MLGRSGPLLTAGVCLPFAGDPEALLLLSLWLYLLLQGDFQVLQEVRATTTVAFQQPLTDKYFEAYSIPFSKTGRPLQAKKELQANPWFLVYNAR